MSLAEAMPRSPGSLGERNVSVPGVGKLPVLVFLYLATIALPIGFNVGTLAMTGMRVVLLITILPLFFGLLGGKYGRILPVDILFILHILWATISMAVNNPNIVVQNMGSTSVEFLGGYLIGRALIRTPSDFAALARALFFMVILSLPFVITESQTGKPVILDLINSISGLTTFFDVVADPRMGLERSQWVFAHPIHYGLFCSVAFSLCWVAFRGIFFDVNRWLFGTLIGTCTFLALSSGALLALALQIGLIGWAWLFRNNQRRWWLLLGLFAVVYVVIDLLSTRTPIKVFMSYATFSAWNAYWRSIIFDWGMFNVRNNPIFGLGLRNWIRPSYMASGSMDNFWLVMAVRYGIPGFVLIALGYIDAIQRIMRRNFEGDATMIQFRRAWVFTFLGLSFTLCTVHIWTSIYSFVFMMLGAGMWMATWQPANAESATAAPAPELRGASRPVSRLRGKLIAEVTPVSADAGPALSGASDSAAETDAGPADPLRPQRGLSYTRFSGSIRRRQAGRNARS